MDSTKFGSMALEILNIVSLDLEIYRALKTILKVIKRNLALEAVGIRLQSGEDYPYFVSEGFPDKHIVAESSLCAYNLDGQLMRDDVGNVVLDCMCGNVISGRFDPSKPFFTEGGSFWTNSTSELLDSTSEKDRLTRTRNTCNGEGYESVALIPIRSKEGVIGLLQLNDSRINRFNIDTITFMETLAKVIAVVISGMKHQKEREESLTRYKILFNTIPEPLFVIDPDDFTIAQANVAALNQILSRNNKLLGDTCHESIAGHNMPCEIYGKECPILMWKNKRKMAKVVNSMITTEENFVFIEETALPGWKDEKSDLVFLIIKEFKRNQLNNINTKNP